MGKAKQKHLFVISVFLLCSIVAFSLILVKAHERKEFVGKRDATSGYRCRFALSSSWQQKHTFAHPVFMLDNEVFSPVQPSPILQWLKSTLLPRSTRAGISADEVPPERIVLMTFRSKQFFEFEHIKDGYPEFGLSDGDRLLMQRHIRIDGYPATVRSTERRDDGKLYRQTSLWVCVYDQSILIRIDGSAEANTSDHLDREMQAIISSFHVRDSVIPSKTISGN